MTALKPFSPKRALWYRHFHSSLHGSINYKQELRFTKSYQAISFFLEENCYSGRVGKICWVSSYEIALYADEEKFKLIFIKRQRA